MSVTYFHNKKLIKSILLIGLLVLNIHLLSASFVNLNFSPSISTGSSSLNTHSSSLFHSPLPLYVSLSLSVSLL